ncbi:hypothetical protein [uncultured Microbulbifer sp.]|uniref:hypothetical protein n=1 Tax=uncultured Microbulbifer sp. TaxID=348147 RepID=UPI00261AB98D|nr:hypothetical protein [uncultured Microbulbifer sp.]
MKISILKLLTSIAAAGLAICSATPALSQATDTATSMITLQFNENIIIQNVDPVTISDPTPGTPAIGSDRFCVAGSGFSTYSITFQNNGTDPSFSIVGSGGVSISYDMLYENDGQVPVTVVAGAPIPNNILQATNCSNDNATFDIIIPENEWEPNQAFAPFTGTLLITVESE